MLACSQTTRRIRAGTFSSPTDSWASFHLGLQSPPQAVLYISRSLTILREFDDLSTAGDRGFRSSNLEFANTKGRGAELCGVDRNRIQNLTDTTQCPPREIG